MLLAGVPQVQALLLAIHRHAHIHHPTGQGWLCVQAASWCQYHIHAAQAGEAAQEVEPEAPGPGFAMSTAATVWACEAAHSCRFVPEVPNGLNALGLGAPGRMAGPSVTAVDGAAGLGTRSAESTLHAPAKPEPAERQPEPAHPEPDQAQAGALADEHAAPAPLPARLQLAASSPVRGRCIPAVLTPLSTVLIVGHMFGSCTAAADSCQGALHDKNSRPAKRIMYIACSAKDTCQGHRLWRVWHRGGRG